MAEARRLRQGTLVTYSPKVFVPLTTLCRDVCGYCTFARPPRRGERAYLTEDEVLAIARAGAEAGCTEALFTLGDRPEARYRVARDELAALGCSTTLEYLARCAGRVLEETGLLPHLNPGVMTREELVALRPVAASMGIMLETTTERLAARGGPHWASPDKLPARRLETMRVAGELAIPFTSGILVGIGETREERIDALLALRSLADAHGHLREVIVQNFRAKPGTRMADHPDASLEEHLWSIAVARIVLGAGVHVQAPPNLAYDDFPLLLDAGIDDWGGVSPVTVDHVNPEAPWPAVERLREACRSRGLELAPRLPLYPEHVADLERWADPSVAPAIRRAADAHGLAREDRWAPGRARRRAVPRRSRPGAARPRRGRVGRGGARAALRRARRRARAGAGGGRPASPRRLRRRGDIRRHAERPVHERLLLPVRLLRLLEGQARREPARARRTSCRTTRSSVGSARRGSAARRRSASRAGSTRPSRATTTRASSRRSRPRCRRCTCMRSPRSRSGRARPRSGSTSRRTSDGCVTSASARSRARPPRSSTTRCARSSAPTR